MSNTIDTRIVEMKFDNAQFEAALRQTLGSLDALDKRMKLDGASKGMNDLAAASKNVNLSHIAAGVDAIQQKFSALSVIAITALSNIANRATNAGLQMAKSLTIDPIKSGLEEYETNLNSIQTILANTQSAGTTLNDVNAALQELNHYSDQTIYNFSEMAKNIGTFTAAGVDLDTATASIKGIANLAALSGSNSQQAAGAMYQLSQAISAGRVSLQDWNSVVNAGMGGTVFQRALAQTAVQMGTLEKGAVKLSGKMKNATINGQSFRESITARPGQESWLTSDVLTTTLQQFTGDLSDAELAAMGFSKAQIKAIQDQAKMAKSAATEVKTVSQLMGTLREAAGSGWAQTWQLIIGDFGQAKKLWTDVNDVLGGFISRSAEARNKVVGDWNKLGGRTVMIKAIGDVFKGLMSVLKPIKEAFRDIFPATTGKQLFELTKAFANFAKGLKIGAETADRIKRTFAGVFAIFGIGWEIIKQVARVIGDLFGVAAEGEGSFLKITAAVGDFLVGLHEAVKNGEGLTKVFDVIGKVLRVPLVLLQSLGKALADLVDGNNLDGLSDKFAPLGALGTVIGKIWSGVISVLDDVASKFGGLGEKFASFFSGFGDTLSQGFEGVDFGNILGMINTGIFAGILVMIKRFVGSFGDVTDGVIDVLDRVTGPFESLTGTLDAMQNTLRAATLLQIAAAVGILAASTVALSKIDADGLKRALAAMSVMFVQLAASMAVFQKISISGGMLQLILLAGAINVLATAVRKLSDLSWEQMSKGLVGVGGLLTSLALFTKFAAVNKGGISQGAGLLLLAAGIKVLASALEDLSGLSWEDMAHGLTAMAGGLAIMAAALNLVPPSSILSAAAIFVVAASLGLIGNALSKMGGLDWATIGRGLTTMAAALILIGAALALMPPTSILSAAALFVAATAINLLGVALTTMGGMSWGEIAKGLTVLAGALVIIAVAVTAMILALPGAVALTVIAAALTLFLPVLALMGQMSWGEIAKGLIVLAGALAIIGIAGALMTPVIPTLLGLGVAIGLLGVGIMAAGAGVLAFSLALTALAAAGAAGTAAIVGIVAGLIGLLPTVAKAIGMAVISFAQVIGKAGPAILSAITAVLMALLNAVIRLSPKIGQTFLVLLNMILRVLQSAVPRLVQAGANIIVAIFNGIAANIPRIVTAATNVIVAFLNALGKNLPRITDAGVKLIISFVNGVANAIRNNTAEMNAAGRNLASAIVEGMASGITGGVDVVVNAAKTLARNALDAAKNVLGIRSPSREFYLLGKYSAQGYAKGLTGSRAEIIAAHKEMRAMLSDAMKAAKEDIAAAEARLKKLTAARNRDTKAIEEARKALWRARNEYNKASAANKLLDTYRDEIRQLGRLAVQADKIQAKLDAANQKLADAKKTRDDYNKSIKDQYSDLPDISSDTKLTDYVKDLQKRVADTQIFTAQLQKLRELGLNDEMYKELLAKGTDAIPFVTQILDGGKTSVDEINTLGSALQNSASKLGNMASSALYQAAVDAAAGLVKGLEGQMDKIEIQMDKIADAMVEAIKRKLGIRSPSREFMKIGNWSVEGLAQGLEKSNAAVQAAESVGHGAIDAMRKTLTGLSDIVNAEVDANPTIRPVLDLSDIEKKAGDVSRILGSRPLDVEATYSSARHNAAVEHANEQAFEHASENSALNRDGLTFNQYNNSPKALSRAEIYRQTKNQLSVAKEALTK